MSCRYLFENLGRKGHDLNGRFSKIDFWSRYGCSRCQIKKLSLMGCLKCQDEISKNFHFQPEKWPILKILASNPKKRFGVPFLISSTIYDQLLGTFRAILTKYSWYLRTCTDQRKRASTIVTAVLGNKWRSKITCLRQYKFKAKDGLHQNF